MTHKNRQARRRIHSLIVTFIAGLFWLAPVSQAADFKECAELLNKSDLTVVKFALHLTSATRRGDVIGQYFMDAMVRFPQLNLRHFETLYRDGKHPHIYLLALPADRAPKEFQVKYLLTDQDAPFYLWIETNGPEKAAEILAFYGLDAANNLENLEKTGFLIPDEKPH